MQLAKRRIWFALISTMLLHACQSVDSPFYTDRWRAPELVRARSSAEFERQIEPLIGAVRKPKTIFIGVYGGNPPPWEKAAWFDPQRWPSYQAVDLQNEVELNRIAFHDSLMHVVALHVGKLFPNNVTLMIHGDSDVVSSIISAIYARGDRVFLIGHSFGGRVIGEIAHDLNEKSIPVEMLAYIESFWSKSAIPANVRHAFNFYVPVSFAVCPGLNTIKAEDERTTQVTNVAVPDPAGPYSGFCAEHRNIDSDPRVWKRIVEFLRQHAGGNND